MDTRHSFGGLLAGSFLGLAGCAHSAAPVEPTRSAAELEAEAAKNERAAARHEAKYDPAKAKTLVDQSWSSCPEGRVCWSDRTNPTEVHQLRAEQLRERAEALRERSAELRQVEAKKCAHYDQADRDMSPFAHAEDIRAVDPLWRTERQGTADLTSLSGARVRFSAVPGLSQPWLQGLVDCHMARAAVDGYERAHSPLSVPEATATVDEDGGAFSVRIEAPDDVGAREILERAEALDRQ